MKKKISLVLAIVVLISSIIQVYAVETGDTQETTTQKEVTIIPNKTIDAFRDGDDNPDTTLDNQDIDKTDLYRLYLDMQIDVPHNPIDLLIIVDQSGSMHLNYSGDNKDMTKEDGERAYRDEALRLVLNGTSNNENMEVYEANKQKGLIYQFLAANDENQVAVVGFQGHGYIPDDGYKYGSEYKYQETDDGKLADVTSGKILTTNGNVTMNVPSGIADENGYLEAETLLDWTSEAQLVDARGIAYNATNYTAAFVQAGRVMDLPAANNNHQKVVLFLSDGLPTCHIEYGGAQPARPGFPPWIPATPAIPDHYYRDGHNYGTEMIASTREATMKYFQDFAAKYDFNFYAMSICPGGENISILEELANSVNGESYNIADTNTLRDSLKQLMLGASYAKLSIEDTLSQYVNLYSEQPDFKITRKEVDGTTITTLYENGAVTEAGSGVIDSVTYDVASKKVIALFESTYKAEPGTTITLSFNVQTNQEAYLKYAQSGYIDDTNTAIVGDENTDYNNNATSSNLPGFHSNELAVVKYEKHKNGEANPIIDSQTFPHPVVQVSSYKIVIEKTDSTDINKKLSDAEFTLYRKTFTGESGEAVEGQSGTYVKVAEKLTTDANGQIVIDNLIPCDYCLVETKAPASYRELTAPIAFTLSRQTNGDSQIEGSDLTITVGEEVLPAIRITNIAFGYELPGAGGIGSTLYTIGGLLLMITTAMLLLYKQKCKKE